MSNRLGGRNRGLSYLGTASQNPPNITYNNRRPIQYDINATVGDFWYFGPDANPDSTELWVLMSLAGDTTSAGPLAHWSRIGSTEPDLISLTGNSGGAVFGDMNANINVLGDGTTITVSGNPGTNTETISIANVFYSTGAWTPVLSFSGDSTGITYGAQVGKYTRFGNMLFFFGVIGLTSKGMAVGDAMISGFPIPIFAAGFGDTDCSISGEQLITVNMNYNTIWGRVGSNVQAIVLRQGDIINGNPAINLTNANLEDTTVVKFEGFYFIS